MDGSGSVTLFFGCLDPGITKPGFITLPMVENQYKNLPDPGQQNPADGDPQPCSTFIRFKF